MSTKLILTNDIEGLGLKGDVVEVKNGYAKNYILPKNLAVLWSKNGEKEFEKIREIRYQQHIKDLEAAAKLKEKFDALSVTIESKITDKGKLYGGVTTSKIAELVNDATKANIQSKQVLVTEPIKEVGNFAVSIKLYDDVVSTINVSVEPIGDDKE